MNLGDLAKTILPAAVGAFAGPAAGAMIPGMAGMNPFLQRALISAGTGLLTGQKLQDAAMSGAIGGGIGALFPQQQAQTEQMFVPTGPSGRPSADAAAKQNAGTGTDKPVAEAKTMSAEALRALGMADENLLFKLLNTKMGEGVAAGLVSQLLAGGDDEDPVPGSYEERAFGAGGPGGRLGGIRYMNQGGDTYFPRRNGGIDPSEGSGKKDDVPAMLMAGEFVMTRDAVKGAGNGNLRQGINKMYDMMDNLERMA